MPDDVLMRIVIQDDGRTRPPEDSRPAPVPAGSPNSPGFNPPQQIGGFRVGQEARLATQQAARRQSVASGPTAEPESKSSPMDEALRRVGRHVGFALSQMKSIRESLYPTPPEAKAAPAEVTRAPVVQINDPKQAGASPHVVGGEAAIKINAARVGAPPPPTVPPNVTAAPGAAGAGGAGAAGMSPMAAAGLAGAIVAAAYALDHAIKGIGEHARERIGQAAGIGQDVARNDAVGAFTKTMDSYADMIGKVTPVGRELIKTEMAMVKAFDETTKVFLDRAHQIGKFSPDILQAENRQFLRQMRFDIKEANRLGPSYARLQDNYGELENTLKELLLPIKSFIINKLNGSLELVNAFIDFVKPIFVKLAIILPSNPDGIGAVDAFFRDLIPQYKIVMALLEWWLGKQKGKADNDLPEQLSQFFEAAGGKFAPDYGDRRDESRAGSRRGMNIPAFINM